MRLLGAIWGFAWGSLVSIAICLFMTVYGQFWFPLDAQYAILGFVVATPIMGTIIGGWMGLK